MAKFPNHFIFGKPLKKPNLDDLAFLKAKWQPCWQHVPVCKHIEKLKK